MRKTKIWNQNYLFMDVEYSCKDIAEGYFDWSPLFYFTYLRIAKFVCEIYGRNFWQSFKYFVVFFQDTDSDAICVAQKMIETAEILSTIRLTSDMKIVKAHIPVE